MLLRAARKNLFNEIRKTNRSAGGDADRENAEELDGIVGDPHLWIGER